MDSLPLLKILSLLLTIFGFKKMMGRCEERGKNFMGFDLFKGDFPMFKKFQLLVSTPRAPVHFNILIRSERY